ncbi:MAG: DUF2079 domain-containing protein [Cyanobacteria bacterium RU_5_0]|nr:DUF2079 domain-containing protein [Cyanobacteria bacterium RU_5_0]
MSDSLNAIDPSNSQSHPQASPQKQGISLSDRLKLLCSHFLTGWIGGTALFLFMCSSVRHLLIHSTGFDLGIYDQVVYLMSQGLPPISSYLGFHHMGNHAAWSVYFLAILYKLYPSPYWLLAIQAICLASGALPTWLLASQAGLNRSLASAMAAVYLLYPLIFNLNLFDFHPEVMALPAILTTIWAARADRKILFCLTTVFALGCRDALSLTIAAMGWWLLVFEKRRFYGIFALIAGASWFLLVTEWIIPMFKGGEVGAIDRYAYLGDSVLEVVKNLLLNPNLWLTQVFSQATFNYLLLVTAPVLWGLSLRHFTPLVAAMPALTLNILSTAYTQRDLHHQYALPILPFLLVSVMATLAAGQGWLRQRRWIVLWSLVALVIIGKYSYFWTHYFDDVDTWRESRQAIALIQTQGGVITDNFHAAQVSHRPFVYLPYLSSFKKNLANSDYVLLNLRHTFPEDRDRVKAIMKRIRNHPDFQLIYDHDEVYLFTRRE